MSRIYVENFSPDLGPTPGIKRACVTVIAADRANTPRNPPADCLRRFPPSPGPIIAGGSLVPDGNYDIRLDFLAHNGTGDDIGAFNYNIRVGF